MKLRYLYLFLCLSLVISSCSDKSGEEVAGIPEGQQQYVDGISVKVATRAEGDGEENEEGEEGEEEDSELNPEAIMPYSLAFDTNSKLFVSQMTTDIPAFLTEDVIYNYSYIPGTEGASWDDEESYNFAPNDDKDPLEWFKISAGDTYHGGYSLYALHFPDSESIRQHAGADGLINYSVLEDQSTLEGLKMSDVLGGYHSTEKLFTRIRFKLFHLMTYLHITLYVPQYSSTLHTGYQDNALDHATLTNVTPDFAMQWTATITSDEQAPVVNALNGDGEILMYQHPGTGEDGSHPVTQVNYKEMLGDGYFDQGLPTDYDDVRVYEFSVIIPPQKGFVGEDGKESTFTDTNFLHFYVKSNSGAIKHYYFNQTFSANTTESNLKINQGNFQDMKLYLPRVGDKAIYIGAKVQPWSQRATSFQLTQQQ